MILNFNKIRVLSGTAIVAGSMLALVACIGGSDSGDGDAMQVVASMYPLEYFVERVGGDRVVVESVISSGADAHDFEPTPGDLRDIAAADVFIYNGLGFESWVDALLSAGDAPGTAIHASLSLIHI